MMSRDQKIEYCKNNLKIGNLYLLDVESSIENKDCCVFYRSYNSFLEITKDINLIFLGFRNDDYIINKADTNIAVFYSSGQEIWLKLFSLFWNEPSLIPAITNDLITFKYK